MTTHVAPLEPTQPTLSGRTGRRWRTPIVILGLLLLVHVLVLRAMGRIWWCDTGDVAILGHGGQHNSQHLLDWYTPSHFLHGVLFYWLLRSLMPRTSLTTRLCTSAAIEIGWEIIENTPWIIDRYRAATTAVSYYGDSIANSVSDGIACVVGFLFARWVGPVGSIAAFVFFELLTLALIRDNLTLNVVMLLMPIDAIRTWQGGA